MNPSGAGVERAVEEFLEMVFVACEECGRVTADYRDVTYPNHADGGVEVEHYCRRCWGRDDD